MRNIKFLSLAIFTASSVFAQVPSNLSPGGTYIPGTLEVRPFVPPTPAEPRQPLTDAEATFVLRDEKGVTTTLQRGKASMAPDLPEPAPAPDAPPNLHWRPLQKVVSISMGGVIYDQRVSVVHWKHPVTKTPYEAVLGFDISLLSPVNRFIREGVPHHTILLFSQTTTTGPIAQRLAARGRPIQVPEIAPDAYRLTKGDPADTTGLSPLIALRDLYLAEKPRLLKLRIDLAERRAEAQAWADAHPPIAEPPVFWFKPHRNSRYLTEQDIADQQQAADQRAEQEGEAQP